MMRTPSPLTVRSAQSRQQSPYYQRTPNSNYSIITKNQNPKSSINYFKLATKKIVQFVAKIFFWDKKVKSNKDGVDSSIYESDHVGELSCSVTHSDRASSTSFSKLKHSSSYASSAASVQLGVVDLSFDEIYTATGRFSPENIIGQGGFGTVYKGKLKNGSLVAVKRARKGNNDQHLSAEYRNEILTLSKIEHINLVRFYGYLEHGDERLIVVEYVSNGTLREHLDGKLGNGLELAERLEIVIDVAHAITYLHTYSDPPIIHRDIKSSNILINEKFRAKVADFGFARLATEDPGATHISTQVKGTSGYVDPEYINTYQLTEKSDVYSFGVVLLEIVTGRYPIESKRPANERVTIKWAMQRLKDGEVVLVMDPRLRRSPESIQAIEKVLKLARRCLAPSRQTRPSMRKCAEVLWEIRKDFRQNFHSEVITRDVGEIGQGLYEKDFKQNFHSA